MDIIKYFHEEPTPLEGPPEDRDPDARRRADRSADAEAIPDAETLKSFLDAPEYYRGYLAGTNIADDRVGLTSLRHAEAFVDPITQALGGAWWAEGAADETITTIASDRARDILRHPSKTAVLVTADEPVDDERLTALIGSDRRTTLGALRDLLPDVRVVLFPRPAHNGFDWSLFSGEPLRETLVEGFKQNPYEGVRRFVIPYQKARSEHKFYFESWQLEMPSLPDYVEEV